MKTKSIKIINVYESFIHSFVTLFNVKKQKKTEVFERAWEEQKGVLHARPRRCEESSWSMQE